VTAEPAVEGAKWEAGTGWTVWRSGGKLARVGSGWSGTAASFSYPQAILLCRGSTREVVLDVGGGVLERHQLRAGGSAPQRFAGWHEWPVAGAVSAGSGSGGVSAESSGAARGAAGAGMAALRPERKKAGVPMDAFLAGLRKKHGLDGEPGKG
jgi:hypothetical protein